MRSITPSALRDALEEYDYDFFGLRVQDECPALGERLEPSRIWIDGEPTTEFLSGTSAIAIQPGQADRAIRTMVGYLGRYVVLLGSDGASRGGDEHEIVMHQPTVLERWLWGRRPWEERS